MVFVNQLGHAIVGCSVGIGRCGLSQRLFVSPLVIHLQRSGLLVRSLVSLKGDGTDLASVHQANAGKGFGVVEGDRLAVLVVQVERNIGSSAIGSHIGVAAGHFLGKRHIDGSGLHAVVASLHLNIDGECANFRIADGG